MSCSRENFRVLIFYDLNIGLNGNGCFKRISKVFSTSHPHVQLYLGGFENLNTDNLIFKMTIEVEGPQ